MIIKGKEYSDHDASIKFMDDFCELIDTLKESSEDRGMVLSYQTIAQTDRNPDDDVWIFESDLYDLGWDKVNLSLVFSTFGEKICSELSDQSRGVGDVFLWKWSSGKFDIGGYGWSDTDSFDEDVMIKYTYGWQRHKYGQIFLKQNGYDTDEFLTLVSKSFWTSDIEPFLHGRLQSHGVGTSFGSPNGLILDFFHKIRKINKIDGNRISIPYKQIVDMINVIIFTEGWVDNKEETVSYSYFLEFIKSAAYVYIGSSCEESEDYITCEFGR